MLLTTLWVGLIIASSACCEILPDCPKTISTSDGLVCNKESVLVIRIRETNLTFVSIKMFDGLENVRIIDLSDNRINYIQPGALKFAVSALKIDLTNNRIKKINNDTFGELKEMRNMLLSDNLIDTIGSKSFQKIPHLQLMELKNNRLRKIAEDAFRVNSTIYWLSLRNNSLENISFVRNLYNLSKLDCTSNNIRDIKGDIFKNVAKLSDFQCMNNRIQNLTFLRHLPKLVYLDLSSNLIKEIPVTTFNNLKDLRRLILSNNKIDSIFTGTFAELEELEILALDNNNLVTIGEIFDALINLKRLYLMNNHLEVLSNAVLDNPIHFYLYIDGNNWTCQFIKKLVTKSPKQVKFSPQNNVTNYNNVSCVDKDFKTVSRVTELSITNNGTTTTYLPENFNTYVLPVLIALILLLTMCVIIYFLVLYTARFHSSNRSSADIPLSILSTGPVCKYDANGYLEPRQVPREENVYEEIVPVEEELSAVNLIHIAARKNDYIL